MTRRLIKHTTFQDAMARCEAISKADGYPKAADVRGSKCPPHPFGATWLSVEPLKHPHKGEWYTPERGDLTGYKLKLHGEDITIDNNDVLNVDLAKWDDDKPVGTSG